MKLSIEYGEKFLDPGNRSKAVCELEGLGEEAIPILEAILDGSALNKFDVPYNKLGMPVECSLIVITRLGKVANNLKSYAEYWSTQGHPYAKDALNAIKNT